MGGAVGEIAGQGFGMIGQGVGAVGGQFGDFMNKSGIGNTVSSFVGTGAQFNPQGQISQKGSGLLGWVGENPALATGLMSGLAGSATGLDPYQSLSMAGQSAGNVQQGILSRQSAQAQAQQQQFENAIKLRELSLQESEQKESVTFRKKQLEQEAYKLAQQNNKQAIDTFEAARKLGLKGENLSNFVAQSQAGVTPIVKEKGLFGTKLFSKTTVTPVDTGTMTARR
jgi:hypothetical protein